MFFRSAISIALFASALIHPAAAQKNECEGRKEGDEFCAVNPYTRDRVEQIWKCNRGAAINTTRPCVVDRRKPGLESVLAGSWKLALDCEDGSGTLTWIFRATSPGSFSTYEATDSKKTAYSGSISGNTINWLEHRPEIRKANFGVKASDRTWKFSLTASNPPRMTGTMVFKDPDRTSNCVVKGSKLK